MAAFNPCGSALMPTYMALFLGDRSTRRSVVARVLVVGGAVTVGFVAVFRLPGTLVAVLAVTLGACG